MGKYFNVKAEMKGSKLPNVLTTDDFSRIIAATKQPHHRLAFKLGFLCGLRISEIINVQQTDFNKERKLIFVRQGKGSKDRYVPYPTKFITQTEIKKNIPIKCGVRALEISFKNKVKKILKREDLHFHNLRHSFATNLIEKGIPVTDIQFWLGHARLTTTSIYLKISPTHALERYENVWS